MRHEHMRRKATIDGDAEMPRCRADVFVAGSTCGALPATDPWIDRDVGACCYVGIWPHAFDYARRFRVRA